MPTLHAFICFLLVASLASCASPGKPTGSQMTNKTPEEYAACVLPKWQELAPQTTQKSISSGYRIVAPSAVASDEVLDILKSHEGSHAVFYRGSFFRDDKLRHAARECLH